jgi:hypothetical protein
MHQPISPKRRKVRDRIEREGRKRNRKLRVQPMPIGETPEHVPFAVGDSVRHAGKRGVVSALRPGEVAIRGVVGWVPLAEVEIDEAQP